MSNEGHKFIRVIVKIFICFIENKQIILFNFEIQIMMIINLLIVAKVFPECSKIILIFFLENSAWIDHMNFLECFTFESHRSNYCSNPTLSLTTFDDVDLLFIFGRKEETNLCYSCLSIICFV